VHMSTVTVKMETNIHLQSILVATDFSPASEKALRHALSIARHYDAKLYVMHVVSSVGLNMAGPDAVAAATTLALRDAMLAERRLVASGVLRDLRHHVIVRSGDVWTELEAEIKQQAIDLVVIGTHGRTGLKRLVLGSVSEHVFRNACCRVLTVGPCSPVDAHLEPDGAPRSLLFTTDFGDASLKALPYATSLANQRQTRLALLHILSSLPKIDGNRWYTASDVVEMRSAAESEARKHLQQLVANVPLAVEPQFFVSFGEPAEEILHAASELHSEVIVMGLRCREHVGTISHLPWSTAYGVVCNAVCPVLTVRENPQDWRWAWERPRSTVQVD
jgi:nucleotide-binding universal stress UspA family protein